MDFLAHLRPEVRQALQIAAIVASLLGVLVLFQGVTGFIYVTF